MSQNGKKTTAPGEKRRLRQFIVCLLLFGLSRFSGKAKKGFTVLLCVFYAFFCLSLICGYTEKLIV